MSAAGVDNRVWFATLCVLWGGTWLAVKVGVTHSPPMLVACVRAVLAGLALLAFAGLGPVRAVVQRAPRRMAAVAFLTVTLSYAAVFWGTARLSTGVSAIANNATMPIGLLAFGVLLGEERATRRQGLGIALGVAGLVLLFARRTGGRLDTEAIAGLAAIVVGGLAYCLGAVLARPLLREASPAAIAAPQLLAGGLAMAPVVWLLERPDAAAFATLIDPAPLAGMAWMVLAGGVAATFLYLRLLRDWGPARSGMYAFVTPIIATLLGVAVLGERMGALELAGAVCMLAGAALVIAGQGPTARPVDVRSR